MGLLELNVSQIYAPISTNNFDITEKFYEKLQQATGQCKLQDPLIITGNFYAKIVSRRAMRKCGMALRTWFHNLERREIGQTVLCQQSYFQHMDSTVRKKEMNMEMSRKWNKISD